MEEAVAPLDSTAALLLPLPPSSLSPAGAAAGERPKAPVRDPEDLRLRQRGAGIYTSSMEEGSWAIPLI